MKTYLVISPKAMKKILLKMGFEFNESQKNILNNRKSSVRFAEQIGFWLMKKKIDVETSLKITQKVHRMRNNYSHKKVMDEFF